MYSVLAIKPDYSFAINIFTSDSLDQCVSVATTCYKNSKIACFKVVDEDDNPLISYLRKDF